MTSTVPLAEGMAIIGATWAPTVNHLAIWCACSSSVMHPTNSIVIECRICRRRAARAENEHISTPEQPLAKDWL
jgi:hypothetical protein